MRQFSGRWAVVTGAAGGIGKAVVLALAEAGLSVLAIDCDDHRLRALEAEMQGRDAPIRVRRVDVANANEMSAIADEVQADGMDVAVLVNNAGVDCGGPILERSLNDWHWVLGVNLWGVIHGIHFFVPMMQRSGRSGAVVNVASISGLLAPPLSGIYNTSKHGIVALTETLAHELQMKGSRITAHLVCPGFVRTEIFNSERSRPAHLCNGPGIGGAKDRSVDFADLLARGMEPGRVAEHIVEAVHKGIFGVFPHPELLAAVGRRTAALVESRLPANPLARFLEAKTGEAT